MLELKKNLFLKCKNLVEQKITAIKDSLIQIQEAANNETKSSAGDKHETGRAMAQLETEKLSAQLAEVLKTEQVLTQINPNSKHQLIGLGSLVITNYGKFYISISIGKVEVNNEIYFAISSISPIGKLLLQKTENDSFIFNGRTYLIEHII